MKCSRNCIFIMRSQIRPELSYKCLISRKIVKFDETCPYGNKTVTELNMWADYNRQNGGD